MTPGQLEYFSKVLTELVIAQACDAAVVRLVMPQDSPDSHLEYFKFALSKLAQCGYRIQVFPHTMPGYIGAANIFLPRRKD